MEQVSDYLVASERTFQAPDGSVVRMIYATRTATAAYLPVDEVEALLAGKLSEIREDVRSALRDAEAIVDDAGAERDVVLERQRRASSERSHRKFTLLPTTYCNMGCSYCGQQHQRGRLSDRHRDAVAERVLAGISHESTQSVRINWFGAEPMVGYPVIRQLAPQFIAGAAENEVTYESSMVTNGSLLTLEKLRTLRTECGVTLYDITLDGPARIHDLHRPLKRGGGSFKHIVRTLQQAAQDSLLDDVHFTLRTNVDVTNVEWVEEYLHEIARLGFNTEQFFINIAPVYPWGNDVSAIELDRARFSSLEVSWMRAMASLGLRYEALPENPMKVLCSAVTQSRELMSSSGNLLSCSEYALVPQHEQTGGLGRIEDIPVTELRPLGPFDDWHDAVGRGETPCHSCVFLPVCGGACPKQWREGSRPCPPYKYGIQERLELIAHTHGLAPTPFFTAAS